MIYMKSKKDEVMQGKFIAKVVKKKITPFGTSGHVTLGKEFIGYEAEIKIIKKWMICRRCSETYVNKENFSPDPRYCNICYDAVQYLEKNKGKLKCEKCNAKITPEEYKNAWDREICSQCLDKEMEENE